MARAFGRAVATRREALGWSQQRLADIMGLKDAREISLMEVGRRSLQQRSMQRLADALCCDIEIKLVERE